MSRYVIYGAGGVGCLIGGQLYLAGQDVVLIARGAHGKALAREGLCLKTPGGEYQIRVPVALEPDDLSLRDSDVVVLATKTQDAIGALGSLANVAPPKISIVCAQNGLESERLALRLFERVYSAYVFVATDVPRPGLVCSYSEKKAGILDVGRFPHGQDKHSAKITKDLENCGFKSNAPLDVTAWKRGKLLVNLANSIHAACSNVDKLHDLIEGAKQEAIRCFNATGVDFVTAEHVLKCGLESVVLGEVDGRPFPGGSTSQSLDRGAGSSEVDYLNGEVVLLGRLAGINTPINSFLQKLLRGMVTNGSKPGSMSASEVRRKFKAEVLLEE